MLRPEGVLIFKWNETYIPLSQILPMTPHQPLFGHRSSKTTRAHWLTFLKTTSLATDTAAAVHRTTQRS